MNTLGIIAGFGRLPVEVAKAVRETGRRVIAIGVLDSVDHELQNVVDAYYAINVGQLTAIIDTLKQEQVAEIVLIGKVNKELLFQGIMMDGKMRALLASLPNNNDDTLMLAFVREFVMSGMQVLDQTLYIQPLLAQEGLCTARQPSDAEWQDIEYGFAMAKEIGRLDIGQTVVVKNKAVLAVEAIEGTDAAIRRGGQLAQGGAIVAKVAKPQQDVRFDMPGVGTNTLQSMIEAGAKVLVVEAGKTLLVDRAKVIKMADEHGIAIVAINR
jgi:UDP-2,3-diacylglucosamine hydrolase